MRKKILSNQRTTRIETISFTAPAMIMVVITTYIPFALSIVYSVTNWKGLADKATFVGLDNFIKIFASDPDFMQSALFTIRYSVAFVVLSNILALALAVILARKMKFASFFRAVFFVPYVVSMTIVGFIWEFIFTQGFSSLYKVLGWGFLNLSWLGSQNLVYYGVVLVGIWQALGFYMVLYIAGLKTIPNDVLEAAEIDGASTIGRFFRVKLPLLIPSITTCLLMSIINSLQVFDTIMAMTKGGPGIASMSLTLNIYQDAFIYHRYGIASAKAVVFFIMILLLTKVILNALGRKEVDY